jgi:O-antigen ligase
MRTIKELIKKLEKYIYAIKDMKQFKDFFMYPKESSLSTISYVLIVLWAFMPVYRLLFSLTLKYHDPVFYYRNDEMLANAMFSYLRFVGYWGLIIGIYTLPRSIINARDKGYKIYLKEHMVVILLALLMVFSALSILLSDNIVLSFYGDTYRKEGLVTYIAYVGLFMAGLQLKNQTYFKQILIILLSNAVVLSILSLVNIDGVNQLFNIMNDNAIFHNSNHYGYYLNMMIFTSILFIMLLGKKNRVMKTLGLIALFILTFNLIENQSFGSYLASALGMAFFGTLMYITRKDVTQETLQIVLTYVIASFSASIDTHFIYNELTKLVGSSGDIIEGNDDAPYAGSGRWALWTNAFKFMLDKPLFGYGVDNLGESYALLDISNDRPHNEYLQIGASIGIPALLSYVSALGIHYINMLKYLKTLSLTQIGLYSLLFAYLVGAFFGNSMFYTTPYFVIFLSLSISLNQTDWSNDD